MTEQTNKCALVTGASRGIGAAIAQRLAADGFSVVVNYASDANSADEVVAGITGAGGRAVAARADVSDSVQVRQLFDRAECVLGVPSILVNSAGVMQLARLSDTDDAMFERLVAINLRGTFNMLREAARRMQDGGRIVNLSTSVKGLKLPDYGVYAATKAAVEVMGDILSKELRGRNITVNSVAPGPTATDLFLTGKTQAQIDGLAKANPLERLGLPKDIANAVAFLAGPDGAWINGQTLRANGGMI